MCKWETGKLSEFIDIIGGGTPKTSVSEYWNGNIPWLSVVDFNNDFRKVYHTEKNITPLGLEKSSTKLLNENDIIISARGTVGAIAQLSKKMAFNQSCYGIRGKGDIDNTFLYYLIKTKIEELQKNSHGSVFSTITRDTFESISVTLPPLKEQKRIAAILSSLDDKIDVNNQINKNLEEQAQAIFTSWFVDFEPFGGVMPSDWKESTLGDVCEISSSKRIFAKEYQEDGVPFYRGKEIIEKSKNIYISTTLYISEQRFNEIKEKYGVPLVGDILITAVGTLGALFYVGNENFYFKDGNIIWLKNFKELNSIFIYFLMKNTQFKNFIKSITIGSTQQALTIESLKKFPFFVPKNEDSKEIISLLHSIHSKVECNNSYNAHIKQIRDTLLPKLMNGEINA